MSKINGSNLLLYADGTAIASQKTCTVSWEQDLPGASTKDSSGWEEHINGTKRCTCDFDALFSTDGLSDVYLMTSLLNRRSLELVIDGGGFPIVGEADMKSLVINAQKEEAAGLSGSFKFKGPAWLLTGAFANLLTDPKGNEHEYDTLNTSGIIITSAINAAGDANTRSNTIAVTLGDVIKVIFYQNSTTGQLPTYSMYEIGMTYVSNTVQAVSGLNVMTFVVTKTCSSVLLIQNTGASTWSTGKIYCFKA